MRQSNQELNDFIDVADVLLGVSSADDAWIAAAAVAAKRGANAINVVELEKNSGDILWFRSSMSLAWLTDYVDQYFQDIDLLLKAVGEGVTDVHMIDGEILPGQLRTQQQKALGDQLRSWGYRRLDFGVFRGTRPDTVRCITVSDEDVAPKDTVLSRVEQGLITTSITAATHAQASGATPYFQSYLTHRETDILCLLANGVRNDDIAYRLGIAEVTVRAHVISARRKLGAATREEAIAIALRAGLLPI